MGPLTAGPHLNTPQALLSAVATRNFDVPRLRDTTAFSLLVQETLNSFFDKLCIPGARKLIRVFQDDPITLDEDTLAAWTVRLTQEQMESLGGKPSALQALEIGKMALQNKRDPKATGELASYFEMKMAQTILYNDKDTNAPCSALYMVIRGRLMSILRPNVKFFVKMSVEEARDFLETYEEHNVKVYPGDTDCRQYDKTQDEEDCQLEWCLWTLLGVGPTFGKLWIDSQTYNSAACIEAGIRFWKLFQRNSGSATTALGNSAFGMLFVARCIPIIPDDVLYMMFLGDDFIIATKQQLDTAGVVDTAKALFNLSLKMATVDHGYFCSRFIIKVGGKVHYLPDPLKAVEKLTYMKNIADEEVLHDKWVSFADTYRCWDNELAARELAYAVSLKYKCGDIYPAICAVVTMAKDEKRYRKWYSDKPKIIEH